MRHAILSACAGAAVLTMLGACAGPDRGPLARSSEPSTRSTPRDPAPPSAIRQSEPGEDAAGAELPTLDDEATLETYLEYAALNNPGLEAAFQRWRVAVERTDQAGFLPDPRFTYGYYIQEIETRVGPLQHQLALTQTFPWLGTLRDREDATAREANAAYELYQAEKLDLFERVTDAHLQLWLLGRSIDITERNLALLEQFERIARARYEVGATSHPDLIRVQVELGKMDDSLRRLNDLRPSRVADLNAALNRPPSAPLPWPREVPDWTSDLSDADLIDLAQTANPRLLAIDEQIEAARADESLARLGGYPDLTLGLAYTIVGERDDVDIPENGDNALLATLSVNIPLWRDRYRAAEREATANRRVLAHMRDEQANRLGAELQRAIFDHLDARRRVQLYDATLIPKASESLQASLAAFRAGTGDFLDLLDTERTLLEFELAAERARADQATAYARIERLTGGALGAADAPDATEATP